MVQIIQSGPSAATLRQQALDQSLQGLIQGLGAYQQQEDRKAQTLRQQALEEKAIQREQENRDLQLGLKAMEMGLASPTKDIKAALGGTYQPYELERAQEAVPAQYGGKELQGPVQPGRSSLMEVLTPGKEAVPAMMSAANPLTNYTEAKKAKMAAELAEQEAKGKILGSKVAAIPQEEKILQEKINRFPLERQEIQAKITKLGKEKTATPNKEIDSIRQEISRLPVTKDMINIDAALGKVMAADSSPAGDMSLIYGFMKIQDPGSTVREGEFATAQNAGSIPERIRASYNKALNGERLTPNQRNDFKKSAADLAKAQYKTFEGYIKPHMQAVKTRGLDQSQILPTFSQANLYSGGVSQAPPPPPIVHPDAASNARMQELMKRDN